MFISLSQHLLKMLGLCAVGISVVPVSLNAENFWVDGLDTAYLNNPANWEGNTLKITNKPYAGTADSGLGWYDANQYGVGSSYCWATSASNVLQWWQNRHSAYIPTGTPNGIYSAAKQHLEITRTFFDNFTDKGSSAAAAFQWYMTGTYPEDKNSSSSNRKTNAPSGGYWKDYVTNTNIGNLIKPHDGAGGTIGLNPALDYAFENKCAITISLKNGSQGHTVTVWGAEKEYYSESERYIYDDTISMRDIYPNGCYTALYIADPAAEGEPSLIKLNLTRGILLPVSTGEGQYSSDISISYLGFSDLDYLVTYGNGDNLFPIIPEPSMFGLFVGLGALALIGARRRRK